MFLTTVLFRKGIPGKQWIGKYRRPRPVTWQMKRNMTRRLEIESETEYWLSRPYMTKEQEFRHAVERKRAEWEAFKASTRIAKFPPHISAEDHLGHLNISKKWHST